VRLSGSGGSPWERSPRGPASCQFPGTLNRSGSAGYLVLEFRWVPSALPNLRYHRRKQVSGSGGSPWERSPRGSASCQFPGNTLDRSGGYLVLCAGGSPHSLALYPTSAMTGAGRSLVPRVSLLTGVCFLDFGLFEGVPE